MKVFFKETTIEKIDRLVREMLDKGRRPRRVLVPHSLTRDLLGRVRQYAVMPPFDFSLTCCSKTPMNMHTIQVEMVPAYVSNITVEADAPVGELILDKVQDAAIKNREIDYIELTPVEHSLLRSSFPPGQRVQKRVPGSGTIETVFGVRIEVEGSEKL